MTTRPALALAALLALPLLAMAQPEPPAPPGPPPRGEHRAPPSPERMTEHMRKQLDLDEAQTAKVRVINQRFADGMQKLRDEHEQTLRAALTPAQWAQFETLREQRHTRHKDRPRPPAQPE
jgi:Spy/CpxP family protein refolding chaperone